MGVDQVVLLPPHQAPQGDEARDIAPRIHAADHLDGKYLHAQLRCTRRQRRVRRTREVELEARLIEMAEQQQQAGLHATRRLGDVEDLGPHAAPDGTGSRRLAGDTGGSSSSSMCPFQPRGGAKAR